MKYRPSDFEHHSIVANTAQETGAAAAGQSDPGCAGIIEGCVNSRGGREDGQSDLGREPPQHFTQHLFPFSHEDNPHPQQPFAFLMFDRGDPGQLDEETTHAQDK